jgi:aminopeptidase
MVLAALFCDGRNVGAGDDDEAKRKSAPPPSLRQGSQAAMPTRRPTPMPAPMRRSPTPPPMMASRMTPAPMPRVSLPPMGHAQDDLNVSRGAKNVITRCLCASPGERVHILTFKGDSLYGVMARAVDDAGAIPVRVSLEPIDTEGATLSELMQRLGQLLAGATATVLLAPERPSATLSLAIAKTTEKIRARHLHLLQVDERLLAQSVRADPELLAIVNARLSNALQPPCQLRVTSETGTDLEVRLALTHPILSSSGRPMAGTSENLPAGLVYTHPARVSGTLVVDRAIFGPGVTLDRSVLRRSPARVKFSASRLVDFSAPDPAVARTLENYLASHTDASRVGLLVFPTNYLARSDVGIDRQDMLLPGMSISLGFASADSTMASYEAPVQLVLLGRRQTVELGTRKLVDAGRLDEGLVEGIDPFR